MRRVSGTCIRALARLSMGLGISNAESMDFVSMVSESLKTMDSAVDKVEVMVVEGFEEDVAIKVASIALCIVGVSKFRKLKAHASL